MSYVRMSGLIIRRHSSIFLLLCPLLTGCAVESIGGDQYLPGYYDDPWVDAEPESWTRVRNVYRSLSDGKMTEHSLDSFFRKNDKGVMESDDSGKDVQRGKGYTDFTIRPTWRAWLTDRRHVGKETLSIGGREFDCKIEDLEFLQAPLCGTMGEPDRHFTRLRLWTCEEARVHARVPDGVLRWTSSEGEFNYTKLNKETEWKGRHILMSEIKYVGRDSLRIDGKKAWTPCTEEITLIWSDDVPGRKIRSVHRWLDDSGKELRVWKCDTIDYGFQE